MRVQGKVVVVTGGGNGIGRELVLSLLSRGAGVAAVDVNEAALQETVRQAGEQAANLSTHTVDIANKEAVAALPEQVIARHGAVDGLINSAGIIQPFLRVTDLDYSAIERVMNVNFYGTLHVTKAFLPHLLQRPEGHIANVSSMGGFLPVPGQTVYGASKAAVKLFTEGLRSELLNTRVKVTVVYPGAIGTNIAANSGVGHTLGAQTNGHAPKNGQRSIRPLDPRKAAEIIINAIQQDRDRVLVGSDATFMDLIYRVSPKRAADFIFKQMRSLLPG